MNKVYGIQLDDYEEMIRNNERNRMREIRNGRKHRSMVERKEKMMRIAVSVLQRIIGVALIVLTVMYAKSGVAFDAYYGAKDCTFALATIPAGLCLAFGKNVLNYIA